MLIIKKYIYLGLNFNCQTVVKFFLRFLFFVGRGVVGVFLGFFFFFWGGGREREQNWFLGFFLKFNLLGFVGFFKIENMLYNDSKQSPFNTWLFVY